jgi:TetR/AcrR family transcriptional repressor of nem operon
MFDGDLPECFGSTPRGEILIRRSRVEAAETRRRIVETASHMIRERGITSVTIAEVMGAIGLTVGGFYRHFDSKEAMVGEAIDAASLETVGAMKRASADVEGAAMLRAAMGRYLSPEHLRDRANGCPVAALASEAARDVTTRAAMARAVVRVLTMLEAGGGRSERERRRLLSTLSASVGAVVVGRVLEGTVMGEELAEAVRAEFLEDKSWRRDPYRPARSI